jgi:hypothetical protein
MNPDKVELIYSVGALCFYSSIQRCAGSDAARGDQHDVHDGLPRTRADSRHRVRDAPEESDPATPPDRGGGQQQVDASRWDAAFFSSVRAEAATRTLTLRIPYERIQIEKTTSFTIPSCNTKQTSCGKPAGVHTSRSYRSVTSERA